MLLLPGGVAQANWGLHAQGAKVAGNIRRVIHALDWTTQTSIARSTKGKEKKWVVVVQRKTNVNTREVKVSGLSVCAIVHK